MRVLPVDSDTTLLALSDTVGSRNVSKILAQNGIDRTVNIGEQVHQQHNSIALDTTITVTSQRKAAILNKLRGDSDLFEKAALMSEDEWRVLDTANTFKNTLYISDDISLPDSSKLQGDGKQISNSIANAAITQIIQYGKADPILFNEYGDSLTSVPSKYATSSTVDVFQGFAIPWRKVALYSSLADEYVSFPVYPETIPDKVSANYDTMPDLLYQYEPWYTYKSTGPRENNYVFDFHRDMWTGDHRDGLAFRLIQFCKANCYPKFQGSSVHTSYVTLYIGTHPEISGILTAVDDEWDGPIGLDGRQLHCKLTLSITEISEEPLDFDTVKNKQYTHSMYLSGGTIA